MKPAGKEKSGRSRAFTLVELLVVISVIGLLMGILVPALGKARKTAYRTYCMSNLQQIGVAMRSYLDDNRDIFPHCCAFPWSITDANRPDYAPPITKVLGKILKEPKVFICKADTVKKYYKMVGNTSYQYNNGLAGITIQQYPLVRGGAKERDIEVMSDFDAIHPGLAKGTESYIFMGRVRKVFKNYLYADWHVSDYRKQE